MMVDIIIILFGVFLLFVVVIPLARFLFSSIHDHFCPPFRWTETTPKIAQAAPKPPDTEASDRQKPHLCPPKRELTLSEIEEIVDQITFKEYE